MEYVGETLEKLRSVLVKTDRNGDVLEDLGE